MNYNNKKILHIIATRFLCCPLNGKTDEQILSDEFLEYGISLLQNSLLLSLKNQTNTNFMFVVIIHDKISPNNLHLVKLKDICTNQFGLNMVFVSWSKFSVFLEDIVRNKQPAIFINTRVDYDDLIHRDVVHDTQQHALYCDEFTWYGYSNGFAYNEKTHDMYKKISLYKYHGHTSCFQSTIVNCRNSNFAKYIKLHPYITTHGKIKPFLHSKETDKSILDAAQIDFNFTLNPYIWIRHDNTGSIDPYDFSCKDFQLIEDKQYLKNLNTKEFFGKELLFNI